MADKICDWSQFVGHSNLIRYIKRQLETDSVQNVVLFSGNPGIGKSSMAKLLAIEVATKNYPELREAYIEAVIRNNQSTDSIKLFSMSTIEDKEEEIQKVKAELQTTYSSTGKKILILDEAQGIRNRAQDSILIELEHLPKDVYVFLCTTDVGVFQEAFVSRIKATFRLSGLTNAEVSRVLKRTIDSKRLRFELSERAVITLIASWAGNQPRKALNLLENYPDGSLVKTEDLEVFIEMNSAGALVELLKYLYGSMALGIDYIDSLKCDSVFVTSVIELCKVALGQSSQLFSREDIMYIRDFMRGKDTKHIVRFTAEVAGLQTIQKRRVVAAFIKSHAAFEKFEPATVSTAVSKSEDLITLTQNINRAEITGVSKATPKVTSLEALIAQSETME